MKRHIGIPIILALLLAMAGCQKKTTSLPPYLFDRSGEALERLEEVATDLGAAIGNTDASAAGGGHSMNRPDGRGRFMAQSVTVDLNGASHYELVSKFMEALESDIEASGFALGSSSKPSGPTGSAPACDFYRAYTEPGGKADIGEIRLWSTRMPEDRIRITIVGVDFP